MDYNNIVNIYQGDTYITELFINCGTKVNYVQYIIDDYDMVHLYINKYNFNISDVVIEKQYDIDSLNADGNIVIQITADETSELEKGTYFYTIKLERFDGEYVTTIIPPTLLYIL